MRKLCNCISHLVCLFLALFGLMSGLTLPNYSLSRRFSAQGVIMSEANPNWVSTGFLSEARYAHTATPLPDGRILVAGGFGFGYCDMKSSAEIYDPATGTWSPTGSLNVPRYAHTATLLPNGQVLVAGGYSCSQGGAGRSAELYDPATGRWRNTGSLIVPRDAHTATLLANGSVLVIGGYGSKDPVLSAELYDPRTEMWSGTGSPRTFFRSYSAVLLPDGKVLAAGHCSNSAELYDPATGEWQATGSPRNLGCVDRVTLLTNGQALVTGTKLLFSSETSAELYNPVTGVWTPTNPLNLVASFHTATLLPDGQVLIAGGHDFDGAVRGAQLYDPATGTWSATTNLSGTRALHTATPLANGKLLVAGGMEGNLDWSVTTLNSATLFDLGLNQAGRVTSVSAASFSLMGLTSESLGASFGDGLATTLASAAGLPLPTQLAGTTVKVMDSAGVERLAPLFFVSPRQVNYQIPPGTAAGAASMTITSGNGAASTGFALINNVAPSLFTANGNGRGVPAALALRVKADGSQNYETIAQFDVVELEFVTHPIDLGPEGEQVYLVLFGTGIRHRNSLSSVIATIGGESAEVSFAGEQGDLIGVDQINVLAPRNLAGRGEVDVLLTVEARMANPVRIQIK